MATQKLLLPFSSLSILFLLILYCFETSAATTNCKPSACGPIRIITNPFRLKADPKRCGDPTGELVCENDVVSLSYNSQKYYVREINYPNSTIRMVDASVNNDTCSFPNTSLHYSTILNTKSIYFSSPNYQTLYLMSCPYPLKNSSLLTQNFTHCTSSFLDPSNPGYSYIKVGYMKASDVPEMCRIDVIVMTSFQFKDLNNASLSEIHQSLLYGFELSFCRSCRKPRLLLESFVNYLCSFLQVLVVVVGFICAGLFPLPVIVISAVLVLVFLALNRSSFLPYLADPFAMMAYDASQLTIVSIIFAPRFIIFPIALWFLIYKFRRRHLSMYNKIESFLQSDNKLAPIRYSYSDIKKMTKGFKDKLGEGGYGSVYKGKLRSGCDVAVKLLRKSGADDQDFINEISTIGRIHHVNVVKLVGYCAQGSKRALVFDYMPNGSLEKYIFNQEKIKYLNLETKFEIVVGIARGIEYLHRGCDVQILHFDIKPHNILLDDKFVPKVSDFGLAKFYTTNKNAVTMTTARGTIGYVAPELINRSIGAVSYKADVYSFGMLLVEMVSLKKDLIGKNGDSNLYFPDWIYDCLNQGKDIEIENHDNDEDDNTRRLVRKMIIVALWCIQMSPYDRPSMNKVLEMLEGDVVRLQVPKYSSHSIEAVVDVDQSGNTFSVASASCIVAN